MKERGKLCATSEIIILFETTFRQTSLSFKQIFLQRTRKRWCEVKITIKHASDFPVRFCRPLHPAVLLRNEMSEMKCHTSLSLSLSRPRPDGLGGEDVLHFRLV